MKTVIEQLHARATSDGAGVKLLRVFGGAQPERFDPFLMLDEFGSEEASDYIGGFPPHPHRGFETVTYMLQGKMEHQDHMGNVGLLNDNDVQWMIAGKGIIHSEMPKQTEGKMRGFQLWVNLPAKNKMRPAHYEDVNGELMPITEFPFGHVKTIAGNATVAGKQLNGYFHIADTKALYLDVQLKAGESATFTLDDELNTLVYAYDGHIHIGEAQTPNPAQTLSRLTGKGDVLITNSNNQSARFLVLAGKALNEPIAQHGPFVMNTMEEINQAVADYQNGGLTG